MLDWGSASRAFIGQVLSYGTKFYVSAPWNTCVLLLKFTGKELNLQKDRIRNYTFIYEIRAKNLQIIPKMMDLTKSR